MTTAASFRRKVFYVPGFDPFPARRYRELYRREAAEQAAVSGHEISVEKSANSSQWRVKSVIEEQSAEIEFEVLVWSDIVQNEMTPGILATYWGLLRTVWIYVSTGALKRLMHLSKGPVIAALYPVVFLLMKAAFAGLLALKAAQWASGWLVWPFGILIAAVVFGAVLRFGRSLDKWTYAYYLMQDYAYAARWWGGYGRDLEERIAVFAQKIGAARYADYDELLIVGHSSGVHVAISALAHVPQRVEGPVLSFLGLGQVVPMMTALPQSDALRTHLASAAQRADLTWVDVTAPGDGCCFALCDPVAVSGAAGAKDRGPLVFSARFSETLSPQRWRALKWRFFRVHFQYLCAFDRVADYDYFAITAGPQTLADRYSGRVSSASRRTAPVFGPAA
jgi:hypothetical protein